MWRRNQIDEDWERRKEYLIRSLFQDVPLLSPVPEEEESNDSRPSRIFPPSTVPRESPERPYSPLPPLIIEREPNKHDEPPEFYRKLEKRIMKYYKRLFIEDRSSISDVSDSDSSLHVSKYCETLRRASFGENDSDDSEMAIDKAVKIDQIPKSNFEAGGVKDSKNSEKDEEEISSSTEILPKSSTGDEETEKLISSNSIKSNSSSPVSYTIEKQRSLSISIVPVDVKSNIMEKDKSSSSDVLPKSTSDDEIYEEELDSDDIQTSFNDKPGADNKIENTVTSSSSTDHGYRQVTFKADIHRDATEKVVQTAPSLIYEQNAKEGIPRDDLHEDNDSLAEMEEIDVSEIDNNNNSYDDRNIQPIEVMRSPRIHMSAGSLQYKSKDESQCYEKDDREMSRSLEAHTEYDTSKELSQNSMDFEESIDFDILRASVLQEDHVHENNDNVSSCKRKSIASDSPSIKRVRYADVSLQVNFSDVDLNGRILGDNIFAGVPRVFRLCSCAEHLCR